VNTDRLAKLLAFAGVGFMAAGALMLYRQRRGSLHGLALGRGPLITERVAQAPVVDGFSAGGMKTELRQSRSMSIQQRLATIQDLVHKSVQDPRMRKLALDITHKCPARDGTCEAQAVYDAVKQRVRYTGDIAPIKQGSQGEVDGIDLYQAAYRTWEFKGGDCDDHSILISTLLALNGIEPRLRVTAESVSADWGHIYPAAILPKGTSGKPVALDTTLPERIAKFGYEVPYAKNLDFPA
jgi:transglutaminase-like putative cysteine protease